MDKVENDQRTFGEALKNDFTRGDGHKDSKVLHKDEIERWGSDEAKLRKLMGKDE